MPPTLVYVSLPRAQDLGDGTEICCRRAFGSCRESKVPWVMLTGCLHALLVAIRRIFVGRDSMDVQRGNALVEENALIGRNALVGETP
jgi:hypothetical protein